MLTQIGVDQNRELGLDNGLTLNSFFKDRQNVTIETDIKTFDSEAPIHFNVHPTLLILFSFGEAL